MSRAGRDRKALRDWVVLCARIPNGHRLSSAICPAASLKFVVVLDRGLRKICFGDEFVTASLKLLLLVSGYQ